MLDEHIINVDQLNDIDSGLVMILTHMSVPFIYCPMSIHSLSHFSVTNLWENNYNNR